MLDRNSVLDVEYLQYSQLIAFPSIPGSVPLSTFSKQEPRAIAAEAQYGFLGHIVPLAVAVTARLIASGMTEM
jgi:hypothetical protein